MQDKFFFRLQPQNPRSRLFQFKLFVFTRADDVPVRLFYIYGFRIGIIAVQIVGNFCRIHAVGRVGVTRRKQTQLRKIGADVKNPLGRRGGARAEPVPR